MTFESTHSYLGDAQYTYVYADMLDQCHLHTAVRGTNLLLL